MSFILASTEIEKIILNHLVLIDKFISYYDLTSFYSIFERMQTIISREVTQVEREGTHFASYKQKSVHIANRKLSVSTNQGSTTSEETHLQSQVLLTFNFRFASLMVVV